MRRWWDPPTTGWAVLLVCAAGLVAFGTSLAGGFLYDDVHSIADNAALRDLANVPRFFVDVDLFSSNTHRMYRPVLLTSFAVNHLQGDGAAWAYKVTDLAIHLACACMLLALALRWGVARWAATLAAVLFAVHPLGSEAVHMISARSEQLMVFGLLVCIWAHDRARWAAGPAVFGWLALTLVGAGVACGSKETGVMAPALMALGEWLRRPAGSPWLGRWSLGAAARVAPVALVTGAYLLVRKLVLGKATLAMPKLTGGDDILFGWGRDLATQFATMAASAPRFLGQLVWPAGLGLDPPMLWQRSLMSGLALGGFAWIGIWTWLGVRRAQHNPARVMGTALAWATCLPWLLIPLNQPLAEHRAYGLVAGVALAVGASLGARAETANGRTRAAPSRRTVTAAWAVALCLALCSAWHGLRYRSHQEIWAHTLAVNPSSFHAHWGLGLEAVVRGDQALARHHLFAATTLHPGYRTPRGNLADTWLTQGPTDGAPFAALVVADRLLEDEPDNPYWRIQQAEALSQAAEITGRRDYAEQAEAVALSCLDIAAPKALVFKTAARARSRVGDHEQAMALLDECLERGLDHHSVFVLRAHVREKLGQWDLAGAELQRAAQRAPHDPAVRAAFAGLSERQRLAAPPR